MKRLAIFVEGQTEQIFATKLLTEIAGTKSIAIEHQKKHTGQNFLTVSASRITDYTKYYVLIRDCRSDSAVKSSIIDVAEKLSEKGYEKILGLQDVYPLTHDQLPQRERWLNYGVPTKYLPINIILAVMEIEAWFLSEVSHFSRIHPSLTIDLVKTTLSFDPLTEPVESRYNPAKDLDDVYKAVGFAYTKRKKNCIRTVEALDYASLYLSIKERVQSLKTFINEIDTFLS